jgi:lysozyme family protein
MKLVDKELASIILKSKDVPGAVLPSSTSNGAIYQSSALDLIQTDDDAIDLILNFEGGYVEDLSNPKLSSHGGITLSQLSTYLNKEATTDDLKNLTTDQLHDIYKKLHFTDNKLSNPKVRAAYVNTAVLSGAAQAAKTFQLAAGRVLGRNVTVDGTVGPLTAYFINSVPDPNLLIETANCLQIDFFKRIPAFSTFGPGWIHRERAFSPGKLQGVCPELGGGSGATQSQGDVDATKQSGP